MLEKALLVLLSSDWSVAIKLFLLGNQSAWGGVEERNPEDNENSPVQLINLENQCALGFSVYLIVQAVVCTRLFNKGEGLLLWNVRKLPAVADCDLRTSV